MNTIDPATSALLLIDLQNDFIHPRGAYARAGVAAPAIAALPARLKPVAEAMRRAGGWVVASHFTLVPARGGEPFISPHLKKLRPFLGRGDFVPGGFGHALVDELQAADLAVEKVAYSAFYMSRLEWVLRRAGVATLACAGIVTNGGVASTVRAAQVRDFRCIVLDDGCAAFSDEAHAAALADLGGIAELTTCADFTEALARAAAGQTVVSQSNSSGA